jgi:hypothetical protein
LTPLSSNANPVPVTTASIRDIRGGDARGLGRFCAGGWLCPPHCVHIRWWAFIYVRAGRVCEGRGHGGLGRFCAGVWLCPPHCVHIRWWALCSCVCACALVDVYSPRSPTTADELRNCGDLYMKRCNTGTAPEGMLISMLTACTPAGTSQTISMLCARPNDFWVACRQ